MKTRRLGNSDLEVSVIVLGTWAMGGKDWGRVDDGDSIKAIHRAIDMGINTIDSAPLYGNGRAETVVGRALEGLRRNVIIATKCGPVERPDGSLVMDLSPAGIEAQCDDSLRRLKTDWIDLMQVHWNDPLIPVEDTMGALERLVKAGKVRFIGVSNFSADEIRKCSSAGVLASNQPPYNLFRRDIEKEILPTCQELGVGVIVYEPLARGLLTGKFDGPTKFDAGDIRRNDPRFSQTNIGKYIEAVKRVANLAYRENYTTAQAGIAWALASKGVTATICGAKTAYQVVENARAGDLELDRAFVERLENATLLF